MFRRINVIEKKPQSIAMGNDRNCFSLMHARYILHSSNKSFLGFIRAFTSRYFEMKIFPGLDPYFVKVINEGMRYMFLSHIFIDCYWNFIPITSDMKRLAVKTSPSPRAQTNRVRLHWFAVFALERLLIGGLRLCLWGPLAG